MVNITAIKLINRFLIEKKIKHMKKWSTRLPSRSNHQHLTILIKSIRSLLDVISGKDTIQMLKSKITLKMNFINYNILLTINNSVFLFKI